MKKSAPIIFLLVIVLAACSTTYNPQSVEYSGYRVRQSIADSSIIKLLSPYGSSLNATMNEVIANVAVPLERKQPEGTLGNVMADVLLAIARNKYAQHVDASVVNYGGIRLPVIEPGPITRGKLFELSPFDNTVVILTIKGDVLKQFLDHISIRGGWPLSGIRMKIVDKAATDITVGGKPLDLNAQYSLAVTDYVANGGDQAAMLKDLPRKDRGIVFRDELIAYFMQLQKEGKNISSSVEGRITTN